MKISLSDFDLTGFARKEVVFCGVPALLITPENITTKFSWKNRIFRSSIWDLNGNLLSAGLPKFTNWGENPEQFPLPTSLDNTVLVTKVDGSCVIIDFINGQISMRTRGTASHLSLGNANDFQYCLSKHPSIVDYIKSVDNDRFSLIFEITTPNLKIVLDYGREPEFWLIGRIDKGDYSLASQTELDNLATQLGLRRPTTHTFESIDSMLADANARDGIEGWCVYSDNGQRIHKVKCASYLAKHRFKEKATMENTIDLYFAYGKPDYGVFIHKLVETFDYECAQMVVGYASQICDAMKEVRLIMRSMEMKVALLRTKSRKDAALAIQQAYSTTNRASFVFQLLDNRPISDDGIKKLLYQVLKQ